MKINIRCSKCHGKVTIDNDAVSLQYMFSYGELPDGLDRSSNGAVHLFPTGTCPGAPGFAQYFEGHPRCDNVEYIPRFEKGLREALVKLQEIGEVTLESVKLF